MTDQEVIEQIVRAWYHDTNWQAFGDEVQRILRESGAFERFPNVEIRRHRD